MKKIIMIITVLGLGLVGYMYTSTPLRGDEQGGVHIEVINDLGEVAISDYYEFTEETTLFDLLEQNYTVGCADSSYSVDYTCEYTTFNSHVILVVDDVETDWANSFLEITVDDVKSNYGVDLIMLEDDTTYTLTYTSLGGDE